MQRKTSKVNQLTLAGDAKAIRSRDPIKILNKIKSKNHQELGGIFKYF